VNRDTSKIKDFQQKVAEADWNFSTPYKGSIGFVTSSEDRLHKLFGLSITSDTTDAKIKCEITEE